MSATSHGENGYAVGNDIIRVKMVNYVCENGRIGWVIESVWLKSTEDTVGIYIIDAGSDPPSVSVLICMYIFGWSHSWSVMDLMSNHMDNVYIIMSKMCKANEYNFWCNFCVLHLITTKLYQAT